MQARGGGGREVRDAQREPPPGAFTEDAGLDIDAAVREVEFDVLPVGKDLGPRQRCRPVRLLLLLVRRREVLRVVPEPRPVLR